MTSKNNGTDMYEKDAHGGKANGLGKATSRPQVLEHAMADIDLNNNVGVLSVWVLLTAIGNLLPPSPLRP